MSECEASEKEKENDLFAVDVNRTVRQHIIFIAFRIARQRLAKFNFTSANGQKLVEALLRMFAHVQLANDHQSLYESGFFTSGV